MKTLYLLLKNLWLVFLFLPLLISQKALATHAQSADITYQCLGNNQYQISVSFYRDCSGANAPNTINISVASASCNQNLNLNLTQIPGTGNDVTPICNTMTTVCNGGNSPGVEEYIYTGIITLPANCTDWIFSFSLCCRNNAINTIQNPGNENIYVEARLNNTVYACNNSPTFSNAPVSFPCVGQTSCFNHGAFDADGDSLYYTLLAPATGPNTTVTYNPGYSANQPLQSNPATTFNPNNGDICMSPTMQEVSVLAVRVDEYRDGNFIGSVIRDIQLRTVVCNNNLPYLSGINGTGIYNTTVCAGSTLNFNVPSFDIDPGQTVTLNWNNAIPNATFTTNVAQLPTGVFNWTPTANDISPNPYCFTIEVKDDNCPINGIQIYSFCVTVTGFTSTTSVTSANCGASNGSAVVFPQGGNAPYTYNWSSGSNNQIANGLAAGQYTITVTDANGCTSLDTVTISPGSAPGNISLNSINVACFGDSTGSITANVNGGQQPYVYLWSNGGTTPTINNLIAGTYWVHVTDANGCIKTDTTNITQPNSPVTAITVQTNATCAGGNDGTANVTASGGTPPYTYSWNTTPIQNNQNAIGLAAGNYTVTVTDNNGCVTTQNVTITSPQPLSINYISQQNVTCFGGNNGALNVSITGGTAPFNLNWNNNSFPNSPNINNLPAGIYLLIVTDANGCQASTQFSITEPNELSANIVNSTNVSCNGLSDGSIQTSIFGGTQPYTYLWNPTLNTQANINNLSTGYHLLTVTDNNGCTDTVGTFISEQSPVVTIALGDDTICPNTFATITANGTGGTGNYTYQWNNNSSGTNQNVSPNSTTTYWVYATDGNGCVGNGDSVTISVNDINNVTLTTTPDTAICFGESYQISAFINGGIGNYTYTWNNNLGNGQGPFTVNPNNTTSYIVTLTDECGNTKNETVLVNVNPLPNVDISPQTETACGIVNINFSNNMTNQNGSTFYWDFGDNTSSTSENPIKEYSQTGIYNVVLTVTSVNGCVKSDQSNVNVTVNPKPVAQFDASTYKTTMLDPEISFDNYSINANFYEWSFGDGNTSILQNPINTYAAEGVYLVELIAKNTFGCKDTAIAKIEIEPEYHFYIPNAFTPDNDGNNDFFTAVGEAIEEFDMQIFNRWGEKIFETNDLNSGWNGTTKGNNTLAMEGVYVYKIKLRDWEGLYHNFTGKVTLIK
ncbi:MAG: PKD domain-containing protein [Vicingaceae bacterium]|nr:PKD domain-containing protein [Vicingaceae bacterium]